MNGPTAITARRAVALVLGRELRSRLASRAFLAGLAVTVVLIFAVFAASALVGGDDPVAIGVVGDQPSQAEANLTALAELGAVDVEISALADRAAAEAAIEAGEIDAVVVDGATLLMDRADAGVVSLVTPAWQRAALVAAMADRGLGPDDIVGALGDAAPLTVVELDPDPESEAREAVAFASVILLFISVQLAGAYILMGVFEEKSTKVVELVLSSVRARELLLGKILGIGLLGVVQVAFLAGSAVVAGTIFGSSALPAISPSLIASGLVWFVLGYLLYGSLFAAGASLAPRQEDAQATLAPVSVVLMLSYFGAVLSASDPGSTLSRVVSWVPVTAPFAMPGRIASGDAAWWELAGSLAVTAAAAVVVLAVAERIYVRSVIHTDRKLGWREAWSLRS